MKDRDTEVEVLIPDRSSFLEVVTEVVRVAGREVLRHYGEGAGVERKEDGSPLTAADRASHRHLLEVLPGIVPDTPVLSEESDPGEVEDRRSWHRLWLVDPLDGTREFVKGTGEFTVNVALVVEGRPVAGWVGVPVWDRVYRAMVGHGAELVAEGGPPRGIHVRDPMGSAPVLVASRDHAGPGVEAFARALAEKAGEKVRFTSVGSSLKFCLLAEGQADFYLRDHPTMEWDTAAAQCVLEEAGGAVFGVGRSPEELQPLRYNKESLMNPPFLAVAQPGGDWRQVLARAGSASWKDRTE